MHSFRWTWFFAGFLLFSTGLLRAQLINVDFNQNNGPGWGGGGPNPGPTMIGAAVLGAAGDKWNGLNVNSGSGLALTNADGSLSAVKLTFTSGGGYDANSYSGTTPFSSTPYDALMEDYLLTGGTAQTVTLTGLVPSTAYKLVLYNAADNSANASGRTTFFTVNGLTLASVWDAASSMLIAGIDYVVYPSATSDSSGKLIITYAGNGTAEGDLDGFQLLAPAFAVSAAHQGANTVLSFMAQSGFSYQVLYKTNLAGASWTPLGSALYGSNTLQSVNDPATASRFYRVQMTTNAPFGLSTLHARGTNIVNAQGNVVQLKGLNLGGWFIMEKWMCPLDSGSLPDTYSVLTNLDSRFGVATEQSLIHLYQTNWITLTDLNNIAGAGFNCVRMPVWWGNFYSMTNTTLTGWRSDAFTVLDWLVTNCATRGIYVIIDMHGVIGGESTSGDTGWQNQNTYWTSSIEQEQTAQMWTQLAAHFANNGTVAGYDVINEPSGTPTMGAIWSIYSSLYSTIRSADPGHLLFIEGTFDNWDWSMLPAPSTYGWTNIAYSMHEYQYGGTLAQVEAGSVNQVTDFTNHKSWNVPDYVGEWNDMGMGAACYDYSINAYNAGGVSWSMWSYKATDGLIPDGWGWYDPTYWPNTPNIEKDSAATIANDWLQWRTTTSFGANSAVGL